MMEPLGLIELILCWSEDSYLFCAQSCLPSNHKAFDGDEIIMPEETRNILIDSLNIINYQTKFPEPKFGVLQV